MGRHLEFRRGKKSARNAARREADHLRNRRSQKRGGHSDGRIRECFRSQESPREDRGGKTHRASSFTRGNQSQQAIRWFAPGPPREAERRAVNKRTISSARERMSALSPAIPRAPNPPTPSPKSRRKSCTKASPP